MFPKQGFGMLIERCCNHTFMVDVIRDGDVIVDAGAHNGEFSDALAEKTGAKIFGIEANGELAERLKSCEQITYFNFALAGESGTVRFFHDEPDSGGIVFQNESAESMEIPAVRLEDFCSENDIGEIALLKLDIEGAELDVLDRVSDEMLSRIGQITVEFHDFRNQDDIPRIKKIFRRLEDAGFHGIRFSFHTWGDCLFINKKLVNLSLLDRMNLWLLGKWVPGVKRKLGG